MGNLGKYKWKTSKNDHPFFDTSKGIFLGVFEAKIGNHVFFSTMKYWVFQSSCSLQPILGVFGCLWVLLG
jgi:hypothetical protein